MAMTHTTQRHSYQSTMDGALPVRRIALSDLREALARGYDDFMARPSHLVFLGLIYPIAGMLLARLTVSYNILPLLFPLAAGFALLGPFAAIGLYEISRRRERGMDARWLHVLAIRRSPAFGAILMLGLMLTGLFLAWLGSAWLIYRAFMGGSPPASLTTFLHEVLTTSDGWLMMVVGNAMGALFAVLAFSISVVSFPLLLDRKTDLATAVRTSIVAVETNPRVMLVWGLVVTGLLVLGSLPALVGLAVVMPILGHASWHLYRKVVA